MSIKTVDVIKVGTIFRSKVYTEDNRVLRIDMISEIPMTGDLLIKCTEVKTGTTGIMILEEYLSDDIVILDGTEKVNNNVTHPSHYTKNTMECLTFITNYKLDYFVGNAVKYIWRHKHKNGEEDLRKAVYYLSERIKCDDSWNTRDESFEYQPIDHTKLEDMDSVQLAILYSLSLVVTCEGEDKINRIRATIKLLEGYIDEQYD